MQYNGYDIHPKSCASFVDAGFGHFVSAARATRYGSAEEIMSNGKSPRRENGETRMVARIKYNELGVDRYFLNVPKNIGLSFFLTIEM